MKLHRKLLGVLLALVLTLGLLPSGRAADPQPLPGFVGFAGQFYWDYVPQADRYYIEGLKPLTAVTIRNDGYAYHDAIKWTEKGVAFDLRKYMDASGDYEEKTYHLTITAAQGKERLNYQSSVDYTYTSAIPKLADPTNLKWNGKTVSWDPVPGAGYYWVGVYRRPSGFTIWSDHPDSPSADLTKVSHWTKDPAVAFDADASYYFRVRAYTKDRSARESDTVESETVPGSAILGGYVTPDPCTVHFSAGEGSGSMESVRSVVGAEFVFPPCGFTPPTGKEFSGWHLPGRRYDNSPGDSMELTGDVTLTAHWKDKAPVNPFTDVTGDKYYYKPVLWAVSQVPPITSGTSSTTFSPEATCTRGQVVTFLWRAAGRPEPGPGSNPFTDVAPDAYYYKAVLWAVEKGITKGTSETTFSPEAGCTRGQVVSFLYRYEHSPTPGSMANPFTDVQSGAYYYKPVLWAVNHTPQITAGTSATTFSPESTCTRGQIVTFLYRDLGGK